MSRKVKFLISLTISLTIFLILIMPVLSFAQTTDWKGLVPCDGTTTTCDFKALMTLVNKVVNFILFYMAIPIAAIMFVYAGFLMIIPGSESASKKTKGKEIFWNALVGLVLAAAAWLIISTVLFILGYDGSWIGLKIGV